MKTLKNNLPVIFLTLFELAVGIILFINPEAFTKTIILCFGVVLVVIGMIYLVRVLKDKSEGVSGVTMSIALISIIAGVLLFAFPSLVMGLFSFVAIIYGIILVISGVYKTKCYSDAKKAGTALPIIALLSAVASVTLGIVIIVNPFKTVHVMWVFAGAALIFEAALDLAAILLNSKAGAKKEDQKLLEEKKD